MTNNQRSTFVAHNPFYIFSFTYTNGIIRCAHQGNLGIISPKITCDVELLKIKDWIIPNIKKLGTTGFFPMVCCSAINTPSGIQDYFAITVPRNSGLPDPADYMFSMGPMNSFESCKVGLPIIENWVDWINSLPVDITLEVPTF